MSVMADKKKKPDRHKHKPLQLRLHPLIREQLEILAARNLSTLTTEATIAIREHLKSHGLWPPKPPES